MRIVFLTDTREVGGAERHLVDLAAGMAAAGHETVVLAPQDEFVAYAAREAPGARVGRAFSDAYHDAPTAGRRLRALSGQLRRMVGAFRRLEPDVLHVNNGGWPGSDLLRLAPLAGRLAGVPARIMTVHSNPWRREGRLQAVADSMVWRNTGTIVCPSRAVAAGLQERRGMPPSLASRIHYGVDAPGGGEEASGLRTQLTPNGELLVGMVSARAVPEKGYDVLLEALRATDAAVRGVLVGRYPRGFGDLVSAAGLNGRLELPGLQRNVGAYYHAFDLLAVPSTAEECMPLVILEAAAAGTPTFGSRLSGIPEAIDDGRTGRIFPPGDGAALARLIDDAATDREGVAGMGAEAHSRWRAQFTLDRMLAEHEALYSGRTATQA
jgi:glycosyltransferase involved in cell wall biosynthesis